MRYRRDVPRDPAAIEAETKHVLAHLSSCCDPDDDEDARADEVTITVTDHVDGDPELVSITGEIDAEPDAPYLREGYDPDAEPPVEFVPYEEPDNGFYYDREVFAAWRAQQ